MASTVAPPERRRRTQQERREATRTALLDATIECLVHEGYADTTTRGITQRAGVTLGGLHHHFASKAELVAESTRYLMARFSEGLMRDAGPLRELPVGLRTERVLDRLWEAHKGPLVEAGMELWIAARTDSELRASLLAVERDAWGWIAAGSASLFPEVVGRAGLPEFAVTTYAAMRGLAQLGFVDRETRDRAWPGTRAHLLKLAADLTHEIKASA